MTDKFVLFKKKWPLVFFMVVVILLVLNSFNYWSGKKLDQEIGGISTIFIDAIDLSINSDRDLYQAHTASQQFLLKISANKVAAQQELATFYANATQALDRMRQAKNLLKDYPQVDKVMTSFESDYTVWLNSAQLMFNMANADRLEEAVNFNNHILHEHFLLLREHFDVMGEMAKEIADSQTNQ